MDPCATLAPSYVETEARELGTEDFGKFMNEVYRRVSDLVNSGDRMEKVAGVLAIDELLDVDCEENASKVSRLQNFLRILLPSTDVAVARLAAACMGRLACVGGTLTADLVDIQARRGLEWMLAEKVRVCPTLSA